MTTIQRDFRPGMIKVKVAAYGTPGDIPVFVHTKNGTTHTLVGQADAQVLRWAASADYRAGDSVVVNGVTVSAITQDGERLQDYAWAAGSAVMAILSGGVLTIQQRGRASNPNLLDNWYFGPGVINQRRLTNYAAGRSNGYTIDRWLCGTGNSVTLQNGYITYSTTAAGLAFLQWLETAPKYAGSTMTASLILASDGSKGGCVRMTMTMTDGTSTYVYTDYYAGIKPGLVSVTFTVPQNVSSIGFCITSNSADTQLQMYAAKLELGSVQTLAHQDASGNWVLSDPPPHPQQELAKCQRYYRTFVVCGVPIDTSTPYAWGAMANRMHISLSPPMRIKPTLATFGGSIYGDSSAITDATATIYGGSNQDNVVLSLNQPGKLFSGTLALDANL